MGSTGTRARKLRELLIAAGLRPSALNPARPTGSDHKAELSALYRDLGGVLTDPVFRPGGWDLVFDEPLLVIELDEQLHFNRYRAATLSASWATSLPWTANYWQYCAAHEEACLRDGAWGQRWTNASAARMFSGGPAGDLGGAGAPRWKQRALYDAIKDTAPAAGIAMDFARVATYDSVDGVLLDDVLESRAVAAPAAILELVGARTASAASVT